MRLITALTLVLSLFLAAGASADPKQKRFWARFAGTGVVNDAIDIAPFDPTTFVPSPDGLVAFQTQARARGTFGKSTLTSVFETVLQGVTPACPGGLFGADMPAGQGYSVITQSFDNGRDQLEFALLTRELCFDTEGNFQIQDTGIVLGGSGRFADVSGGTWTSSSEGRIRATNFGVFPPVPLSSAFTGRVRGILEFVTN